MSANLVAAVCELDGFESESSLTVVAGVDESVRLIYDTKIEYKSI